MTYSTKLEIAEISTTNKNVLSIVKYERTSQANKAKKIEEFAFDVCYFSSIIFDIDQQVKEYKGENKKAFRTSLNVKYDVQNTLSQLGKNDLKAMKTIGSDPSQFYNEFQISDTKAESIRGFANLLKTKGAEKTIQEKIENFIKSNTTKKDDDGKMEVLTLVKMFNEISAKLHKAKNAEIIDFLPTKKDIAVNE